MTIDTTSQKGEGRRMKGEDKPAVIVGGSPRSPPIPTERRKDEA
jgi:hypothetical protein